MKNRISFFLLIILLTITTSCKKYLEEKPDKKLAIPSSLSDLQAMLDNNYTMNNGSGLALTASDEYYLPYATWNAISFQPDKDAYIWKDNLQQDAEWNALYAIVFYANTVLDNLQRLSPAEQPATYNNIKGAALFFRAHAFYQLAQVFAAPYDAGASSNSYGIPLRLSSSFKTPSVRSTVAQTYDQLLSDFQTASTLLLNTAKNKLRPSRPAAFAMLARVNLLMGNWSKAKQYADSCLSVYNGLIDFNTLNPSAAIPIGGFNDEVIFHSIGLFTYTTYSGIPFMDTVLYRSYADNDLRKSIFYSGPATATSFKGNYYNTLFNMFDGIATDELYLIRAEANARLNNITAAMDDLNTLLQKRWKTGTYTFLSAATKEEALQKILEERRKELVFRGTRWSDLRRLNLEPAWATTIKRVLNNETVTLAPNDNRYTFLVPQTVINLTGMQQNPR